MRNLNAPDDIEQTKRFQNQQDRHDEDHVTLMAVFYPSNKEWEGDINAPRKQAQKVPE